MPALRKAALCPTLPSQETLCGRCPFLASLAFPFLTALYLLPPLFLTSSVVKAPPAPRSFCAILAPPLIPHTAVARVCLPRWPSRCHPRAVVRWPPPTPPHPMHSPTPAHPVRAALRYCRVLRPGGAVVVARAGSGHLHELRQLAGAPSRTAPKQFAAGQGEMYCRFCSQERYRGAMLLDLLEMTSFCRRASPERLQAMRQHAGAGGQSEGADAEDHGHEKAVTVDIITSTHRVWLGTGGFAESPGNLY
eukprot:scaffold16692_cov91-Isochrysis_galbana.AAC.1